MTILSFVQELESSRVLLENLYFYCQMKAERDDMSHFKTNLLVDSDGKLLPMDHEMVRKEKNKKKIHLAFFLHGGYSLNNLPPLRTSTAKGQQSLAEMLKRPRLRSASLGSEGGDSNQDKAKDEEDLTDNKITRLRPR